MSTYIILQHDEKKEGSDNFTGAGEEAGAGAGAGAEEAAGAVGVGVGWDVSKLEKGTQYSEIGSDPGESTPKQRHWLLKHIDSFASTTPLAANSPGSSSSSSAGGDVNDLEASAVRVDGVETEERCVKGRKMLQKILSKC